MQRQFFMPPTRPGRRCVGVLALILLSEAGLAQQADANCEPGLSRDDPMVFEFVETRRRIDYQQYAGMPIKDIGYQVLPVFNEDNPDEDNALYRLFNFFHIKTRDNTLRKQMLIAPGEPLDPAALYENERQLRDNGYLVDAMIVPEEVCEDGISLRSVVRDVWTLYPSGSASRSGGDNSVGVGLTERNLAGTGQEITVSYFDDDERSGYGFSYLAPDLFYPHVELAVKAFDNSDGTLFNAGLERPFFKLDSRWAVGGFVSREDLSEEIDRDDELVNRYQRDSSQTTVYGGWSAGLHNDHTHRWKLGFTERRDEFNALAAPSLPPEDVELRYPWLGWEYIQDRYWTTSNISRSHRQEDIPLGIYSDILLGYASESAGSDRNAVVYQFELGYTLNAGHSHLMRGEAEGKGRYNTDTNRPEEAIYRFNLDYFKFIDPKNRWYINLQYKMARNIRPDQQFSIGDDDTLRGYPSDIQRGNRQWAFTVERRHFTDIHLFNLAWLGGAIYYDVGRTWGTKENNSQVDDRVLSNVGLGLRLSPSKFRIDRVAHIDIAWPMEEGDNIDNYQIILKARTDF